MKRFRKTLLVGLLLLPLALLWSAGWYGYERLTAEQLVAELTVEPLGEGYFEVQLQRPGRCEAESFLLAGDQWQLDVYFVKWKPWANLFFGLDAHYRLDRLQGRYQDIARVQAAPRTAYSLAEERLLDPVALFEALGPVNLFLDSHYGSATFREVDPTLRYRVYRTQSGLVTRAGPRSEAVYRDGVLSLEINRSCQEDAGSWQRSAQRLESWLLDLGGAAELRHG